MLVYKYTSSDAGKLIIENGSLRFSQIEVLNDPFEHNPSLNLFEKSIKEMVSESSDFKNNSKNMSYNEQQASVERITHGAIDSVYKGLNRFLVLSLTKNENNLLMWSHYTESHKGTVIGFDHNHPFFQFSDIAGKFPCYEVRYNNKRPVFFEAKVFLEQKLSYKEFIDYLLTKSACWEYEDEIRMFALPKAATNVVKDKNGIEIYLFDFPKESLKKIIFGSLMKSGDKKKISEIARSLYPHAELFEAMPSENEFALKFNPYKI